MPTTIVYVQRIDPQSRLGPDGPFQDFLVTGSDPNGSVPETSTFQAHTTNPWIASVCDGASQIGKLVAIVWREYRFGKQIVQVDIVDSVSTVMAENAALPSDREMRESYQRVSRVAGVSK